MIYRLFFLFTERHAVPRTRPQTVPAWQRAKQNLPIPVHPMGFYERRHPKNTIATQNVGEYRIKLGGILRTTPHLGAKAAKRPSVKLRLRQNRVIKPEKVNKSTKTLPVPDRTLCLVILRILERCALALGSC